MTRPLITVGITCYAEGDWLLECWESLLAQTDDRWEAVLVMDGTEHRRTQEIFASLEHPKLRKARLPVNMGPYPTRNRAFELTETPYHLYLDGDDKLPPDAIEKANRTLDEHPGVGLVYGDLQLFGARRQLWRYPAVVEPDDFVSKQALPGGGSVYRKALWEQLGGYAPELARGNGDYDFHIGLAEAGVRGVHCGGVCVLYRMGHATKVSSSYALRYHETHEIMVARHPRFFADPRRRALFLAHGERRSAEASYAAGDMTRAVALARSAMRRGLWSSRTLWKIVVGARLPEPARGALRRLGL
ncbi:glycosyltransferase family A protein [Sorangium sp. So ce1335]|uniref:glycosyltransferase family A protein n=1 Tax=Sorangium sp. So ce1335 TaxID=3133335 RepID=UPI003F5D8459